MHIFHFNSLVKPKKRIYHMLHLSRFKAKWLYTDAWLTFGVSVSLNRNKSLIKDVSDIVPCNSEGSQVP
jgi:hypothetical protein